MSCIVTQPPSFERPSLLAPTAYQYAQLLGALPNHFNVTDPSQVSTADYAESSICGPVPQVGRSWRFPVVYQFSLNQSSMSANYVGPPISSGASLDPAICMQLLTGATLNIITSRYLTVAGLTVAIYDIFLLFSDEIRLVWLSKSKLSVRLLYFFNHYVSPAFLIIANYQIAPLRPALSTNFCLIWIPFALSFQVISGMCSSYILLLRVIALYGDKRGVSGLIYTLFFFSHGICIAATIICIISIRHNMGYYIDLGGVCNYSGSQIWFFVVMTSPILFEFYAGILTMYKACKHAYALWDGSSFPLLHSLLRDGIFFCLTILALRLCNAFIWTMLPSGSAYLGLYILWAPLSVMSTRFYLNIKNIATSDPFSPSYSTHMEQRRMRAIIESMHSSAFARVPRSEFMTPMSSVWPIVRGDSVEMPRT